MVDMKTEKSHAINKAIRNRSVNGRNYQLLVNAEHQASSALLEGRGMTWLGPSAPMVTLRACKQLTFTHINPGLSFSHPTMLARAR